MEPQIPTKQGPLLCVSFFILPSHHFPSQHRPCYSFVLNTAQTVETVCLYHFIGAGSPLSLRRKVRHYTPNSSWRRSITSFSMSAVLARAAQVRGRNASHTNKTMASERREREQATGVGSILQSVFLFCSCRHLPSSHMAYRAIDRPMIVSNHRHCHSLNPLHVTKPSGWC